MRDFDCSLDWKIRQFVESLAARQAWLNEMARCPLARRPK